MLSVKLAVLKIPPFPTIMPMKEKTLILFILAGEYNFLSYRLNKIKFLPYLFV